jgi:hypothetical protein
MVLNIRVLRVPGLVPKSVLSLSLSLSLSACLRFGSVAVVPAALRFRFPVRRLP